MAAALGAAVTWFAFVAHTPVPLLDWFDLGVHEAGHLVAAWLPEIVMFVAGSFAQVAFPLAMAIYFGWRHDDLPAAGFLLIWAGASAWDVSVYAADAVDQALPLVGGGQHDWAFILAHFDALHLTERVAWGIEFFGLVLAIAGFAMIAVHCLPRAVTAPAITRARPPVAPVAGDDPWLAAAHLPFRHEERRSA